ncbi:diaminobutyrate acetyltransferase [Rhodococcus sp. NPDC058481]
MRSEVVLRRPRLDDGIRIWQIARDSAVLDLNSSYAYLLWCRDFGDTSVVAEIDGVVVGFVTGYLRPSAPATLFVWQVAVDVAHRGRGIGVAMLDWLLDGLASRSVLLLETTITRNNTGSVAMFSALARLRGTAISSRPLFDAMHFPDHHLAEALYTVGPTTDPDRTNQ